MATQIQSTSATPNLPGYQGIDVSVKKNPFLEGLTTFTNALGKGAGESRAAALKEQQSENAANVLNKMTQYYADAVAKTDFSKQSSQAFKFQGRIEMNKLLREYKIPESMWGTMSSQVKELEDAATAEHVAIGSDGSPTAVYNFVTGETRILGSSKTAGKQEALSFYESLPPGVKAHLSSLPEEEVAKFLTDSAKTETEVFKVQLGQKLDLGALTKQQLTDAQKAAARPNVVNNVNALISNKAKEYFQLFQTAMRKGTYTPEEAAAMYEDNLRNYISGNAKFAEILGDVGSTIEQVVGEDMNLAIKNQKELMIQSSSFEKTKYGNLVDEATLESVKFSALKQMGAANYVELATAQQRWAAGMATFQLNALPVVGKEDKRMVTQILQKQTIQADTKYKSLDPTPANVNSTINEVQNEAALFLRAEAGGPNEEFQAATTSAAALRIKIDWLLGQEIPDTDKAALMRIDTVLRGSTKFAGAYGTPQ